MQTSPRSIRSHMATGLTSSLMTAITVGSILTKPPLYTLCARITPSVVSIQTYGIDRNLALYPTGTGTGFYYKGNIITNAHVLDNAFKITIDHDQQSLITIKGIDYKHDIAIIEAPEGHPVPLVPLKACRTPPKQGQKVLAIGDPYGLEKSATTGIISATHRELGTLEDLIQFDAAVNPGSSGGPLIDAEEGCVLGINTALYSPTGSSAGISFAVPIYKM